MLEGLSTLEGKGYLNRRSVAPWNPPPGGRKDGTPGMRSPGLIKDLIGVIIVMRFRHGMEKGGKKQRERKRRMRRNGSWTDRFRRTLVRRDTEEVRCYDTRCKYLSERICNLETLILRRVDVSSSVQSVRNFEKYLHRLSIY